MRSTTRGDFIVRGRVADPAGGAPLDNVIVVVYLFNADGVCFAASRAALQLDTLRAGDSSTFAVRIHATMPVVRYRVGFRLPDGRPIAHIDKRAPNSQGMSSP